MSDRLAFSISECRKILSEISREDGENCPPDYDWFADWFEGMPEPNPNCDERLREMIHAIAKEEGFDESTSEGLTSTLRVMYFG